jgi:hypothetical protein
LIAVGLGAKKRAHVVEQTPEARSRDAIFESAPGLIPLFDSSKILPQVVIQVQMLAERTGTLCR